MSDIAHHAPRRIGVFMLRQIGDVLLLTPALSALKERFPKAEVTAVVNDFTAPMLQNNPAVDRVLAYPRAGRSGGWWRRLGAEARFWNEIRRARFDLTLDFTGGDRPAFYSWSSGAGERLAFGTHRRRWNWNRLAYTQRVKRPRSPLHQVTRHAALLQPLGVEETRRPLVLRPTAEELAWAENQRAPGQSRTVLAHFVANWLFKCWADEKAAALIDRLRNEAGATVWFTSGPSGKEVDKAKRILELCRRPPRAWLGTLTLRQLAALMAVSDVFVGVDTAPMHMAAALGVPVVALFGPTRLDAWSPWCQDQQVLAGYCCCLQENRRHACDWSKTRACLDSISVADVFSAVTAFLPHPASAPAHPAATGARASRRSDPTSRAGSGGSA